MKKEKMTITSVDNEYCEELLKEEKTLYLTLLARVLEQVRKEKSKEN